MTTPTNHTSSSLFDFGDLLEPEPSQDSLEQNSSIEDSNIFVSVGGEVSNHTRRSSVPASGNGGLTAGNSQHPVDTNTTNDVSVSQRPQQEESEASSEPVVPATTAAIKKPAGNGILKPTSYSGPQRNQDAEERPTLMVDTEPRAGIGDNSMSHGTGGYSGSKPSQPFSPTVHTSNQTSGFTKSQAPFSPTVHTSNQTSGVTKSRPPFSPTVHTSNQTNGLKMTNVPSDEDNNHIDEIDFENLEINKPDVDESAERAAAWAIHIALIFFCALIIVCILLTISVVRNYGFVTWVLVTCIIVFFAFLTCFVDSTILSQNPKLRPVRQKIVTVVRATRKILEDEYQLFIRDWKETLLITQDGESFGQNTTENLMCDDASGTTPQKKRKKSKVFKLIRPFLGLKKGMFKGKGRRQKTKNAAASNNIDGDIPTTTYEAPVI